MIINLLIAFSEIQKLGLLYLAISYDYNSTLRLILTWLLWQIFSPVIFGKLSDIKGRKFALYITISFSILVSVLAIYQSSFSYALFCNGLFAATLPIAFAAKNDRHPLRSKRLTYAEASLARALPWLIMPLWYLLTGLPDPFWKRAILTTSILSAIILIFFNDKQDEFAKHDHTKEKKRSLPIFSAFVFMFLAALFTSECSYQTVAYVVEEKESLIPLTKSYILFGLGMSMATAAHLFFKEHNKISLQSICGISFLVTAFYFLIKFLSFSWEVQTISLNYTEKAILGAVSGVYIPLIYAIVCERFKMHQQGVLCGLLESTMTLAEIISPLLAYFLIKSFLNSSVVFLIIGFGFLISYVILRSYPFKNRKME
ncbi:MAG: hypothetical protein KR126chlam3_01674 [Chlamydiae bacterium]|nr:hypothetical protein [Chlamydiota bacterium]